MAMMKKKYVADKKADRMEDAKKWYQELTTNPAYIGAIKEVHAIYCSDTSEDLEPKTLNYDKTDIKVFNNDVAVCTKAAITHASKDDKVCVLDFASYTNPGGEFLKGSLSQEESICRMSGLYPVLESHEYIYKKRKEKGFTPLYDDDFIYCKDVPFIVRNKDIHKADVLVAAAPNCGAYLAQYKKAKEWDTTEVILNRMKRIYLLPAKYGATILLLGAFGCGVFGNDVETVANQWRYLSKDLYPGLYKQVVHPVFDDAQCKVFRKYV